MPRDKGFQRKKKDTRMPVRDPHAEERIDTRQSQPDFNLLRARDAPSSSGTARSRRYETAAQQATEGTQPFKADMPQQTDISIPEHLAGKDLDHEPVRAPETRNPLEPEPSGQEPRRRDFRYEDSRREDSDTGHSMRGESDQAKRRHRMHQHGNQYQQRFQEAAKAEEPQEKSPEAAEGETKRPSKLEFTADELPPETADKKLTQARRKAERTAEKLEQAENRLPARRKLRMETSSDPDTGKAKKRLKFEKEVKSQRAHVKGSIPMRPVKAGTNMAVGYAHKKIYQAEDENVGIKAAHRTELVSESGLRMAYYRHKTAPYRREAKLQQRSARANARLAYRQTLQDTPELKKNLLARMWQKQKIKRQYAKAAREAKKAGKRAKDTAVTTEKIAAGVVHAVKRHPVICGIVILLLLVFFLITSLFSSFSNLGTGGLGSLAASTYLADDADINHTTPPKLTASLDGDTLKIESSDDNSGVEAVFVDGNRINSLTNGAASVTLKDYAGTEKQVSVYAQDYAGNRSKTVKFENPYYEEPAPTEKPAATVQQNQSSTPVKPAQAQAASPGSTNNNAQSSNAISRKMKSMLPLTSRWLYAGKSCNGKPKNTPGTIRTGWGLLRRRQLCNTPRPTVPLPGCWRSISFPCMTCALTMIRITI